MDLNKKLLYDSTRLADHGKGVSLECSLVMHVVFFTILTANQVQSYIKKLIRVQVTLILLKGLINIC